MSERNIPIFVPQMFRDEHGDLPFSQVTEVQVHSEQDTIGVKTINGKTMWLEGSEADRFRSMYGVWGGLAPLPGHDAVGNHTDEEAG